MDKIIRCRDIGPECVVEACGNTEEEVLRKISDHARAAHGFEEASFVEKARSAIYEGYCDRTGLEETVSEECAECYDECAECVDECCC
jgi:predicted small metal-binding protein